jgi:hypothetical protein
MIGPRSITTHYASAVCRGQLERSPLAEIEMSLSAVSVAERRADDAGGDESSFTGACRPASGRAGPTAYQANYRRLQELKTKYDPKNFFRVNQNIRPVARASGESVGNCPMPIPVPARPQGGFGETCALHRVPLWSYGGTVCWLDRRRDKPMQFAAESR